MKGRGRRKRRLHNGRLPAPDEADHFDPAIRPQERRLIVGLPDDLSVDLDRHAIPREANAREQLLNRQACGN